MANHCSSIVFRCLSKGTILTPSLLYKSGVGPKDRIERLGVEMIQEEPHLGTSVIDR